MITHFLLNNNNPYKFVYINIEYHSGDCNLMIKNTHLITLEWCNTK